MVAKVIAVVNQKGGVGKSTVCLNLSAGLQARGHKTMLADGDPQKTSYNTARLAPDDMPFPLPVVPLGDSGEKLSVMLSQYLDDYDVIIIDGPPSHIAKQTRSAVAFSDITIIPMEPSYPDLESSIETSKVIQEIEDSSRTPRIIPTYLLMNKVERTSINKSIMEMASDKTGRPILNSKLRRLTVFKESVAMGIPVELLKDPAGAEDVAALVEEVISLLGLRRRKHT